MLTSYMVRCPHIGCNWFGSLRPRTSGESGRGYSPRPSRVVFQCPQCLEEWQARVVGEDVVPLPVEEKVAPWA